MTTDYAYSIAFKLMTLDYGVVPSCGDEKHKAPLVNWREFQDKPPDESQLEAWESQSRSELTRAGLTRVVKEGKKLGRPTGSKDKNGRRRSGYLNRWINKGATKVEPEPVNISGKNKQRNDFRR